MGWVGGALADDPPVRFPADGNGAISFRTPSSNIECIYIPAGGTKVYQPVDGGPELQCDRSEPVYMRFTLGPGGPPTVTTDVGDPGCCGGTNVLTYDTMWKEGPFECRSAATGLTCVRNDGRGYMISKDTLRVF
jgi:hypothetical protein